MDEMPLVAPYGTAPCPHCGAAPGQDCPDPDACAKQDRDYLKAQAHRVADSLVVAAASLMAAHMEARSPVLRALLHHDAMVVAVVARWLRGAIYSATLDTPTLGRLVSLVKQEVGDENGNPPASAGGKVD